ILNEREFVLVRTSRNRNKINAEEADVLNEKSIGIVGLSVGQTIASTIALERSAGKLFLADFDNLELSNLNRIRTSLLNSGLSKAVIISREIAELDPFFHVEIFPEGITEKNINLFFSICDIVVDECDDLLIKIRLRENAKKYRKPIVMDTSDNIFIDIERYDIDNEYPMFHGLLGNQEFNEGVKEDQRLQLVMKILEYDTISTRGKESIQEIGKSLLTWPQLASDVIAGGGCAVKIIREILLKSPIASQRFRFDIINHLKQIRS
ncbi:MAG: ThiF family adenylyltransferase, partial [Flavobacteriales bacterium]